MLLPCLRPGQTVVMDNASFHRKNLLRVIFAAAGVHLLFTPAHSPEYNPIETVWGYMKAMLNR
jgi:transposase